MVGIHKLSSPFYHQICDEYEKIVADKPKLGYEYQLLWMSQNGSPVYVHNYSDVKWYEIDDEDDLKFAENRNCKRYLIDRNMRTKLINFVKITDGFISFIM